MISTAKSAGTIVQYSAFYIVFAHPSHSRLRPGGYIEIWEIDYEPRCDDDSLSADSKIWQWWKHLVEAYDSIGKPIRYRPELHMILLNAGFTGVEEMTDMQIPWNHGADAFQNSIIHQVGGMYSSSLVSDGAYPQGMNGLCMKPFSQILKWDRSKIEELVSEAERDVPNAFHHIYSRV